MAGMRLPGPICVLLNSMAIDAGTLCRQASPVPGPITSASTDNEPRAQSAAGSAHVLLDPESYIGRENFTNSDGDHECVEFACQAGGAPHPTSLWQQGTHVESRMTIAKGTWVATFVNGRYHGHVGAFLSIDEAGNLTLIDQFDSRGRVDRTTYHVKSQTYTGRISNDPSKYYEVLW
jgi:hypothetical protein